LRYRPVSIRLEKQESFRAIGEYLISLADLKQEIIGKMY